MHYATQIFSRLKSHLLSATMIERGISTHDIEPAHHIVSIRYIWSLFPALISSWNCHLKPVQEQRCRLTNKFGLRSRRPAKKPFLNDLQRRKRL